VRPEGLGQFKNPPCRDANSQPSGLQHSALTTTLPHGGIILKFMLKNYDVRMD
jgi:hypothetical protein